MPAPLFSVRRLLSHNLRRRAIALVQRLKPRNIEESAIGHYQPVIKHGDARLRLNLVIPSIAPAHAYGGISTCVEFFAELAAALSARALDFDIRVLITDDAVPTPTVFDTLAPRPGFDAKAITYQAVRPNGSAVTVRSGDLFFATTWWTAFNTQSLLVAQHGAFGGRKMPLFYFIQDYEPQLYPLSSASLLARDTYANRWPTFGIFNSQLLADYFSAQGHFLAQTFVFEPKLSPRLLAHVGAVAGTTKRRQILVYGRPFEARNCFSLVRMGVTAFAERHRDLAPWTIISAGAPHKPIALEGGRKAQSVGKLGLDAYAETLLASAVGLSLMASPHPSYPPLEMAHFGLLTITNSFANKDLSRFHDNIISLGDVHPETIGDALAQACRAFDADNDIGKRGKSRMTDYTGGGTFACVSEIAAAIAALSEQATTPMQTRP